MGHNLYIEKIILTELEHQNWQNGMYLSFEDGLVNFEQACELSGVQMKEHYATEDDYNDDLFEVEQEIYWNGFYLYDDRYDFESCNNDCIGEWEDIKVGDKHVIIRAVYY